MAAKRQSAFSVTVARKIEHKMMDKGLARLADLVIGSPENYVKPSELIDCIITVREALHHD